MLESQVRVCLELRVGSQQEHSPSLILAAAIAHLVLDFIVLWDTLRIPCAG